jgi:flavin reductase (DIM6/NTAB) family NADH-FMN oxidoreductase RutF
MAKIEIEPSPNAYRLLNPGSVVLVTSGDGIRDNVFTLTWNMPIRKEPGMVAILSGKRHFSYPLMEKTGEFGINIPEASMLDAVFSCGSTSGYNVQDKFQRFGLTRMTSEIIKAPLVHEAFANLECRICQVVDMGASSLLIAQILRAYADARHFQNKQWTFENGLELLHHLGGDRFAVSTHAEKAHIIKP